jgi:ribonuclease Z
MGGAGEMDALLPGTRHLIRFSGVIVKLRPGRSRSIEAGVFSAFPPAGRTCDPMAAEWTVLGAGSILPRAGFGCAGHALRPGSGSRVTLFDCGPGTLRALGQAGIALGEVERVAVSHFHPDHWLDLLALAFARRNPACQPPAALEIVGPRGLGELLERAASILGERSWLRFEGAAIVEVDPERCDAPLERGPVRLAWVATLHTPESIAWRADLADGSSVAYSGDTGENRAVADLAHDADLFVCECSFPDEMMVERHLTPASAGRLANAARCRRLLLTHFYPSLDPEAARDGAARHFGGPIEVSRDGSVHGIGPRAKSGTGRSGS